MNYTKQLLLIPLLLLFAITGNAQNFGSFASGVFIRQNGNLNTYNLTGDGTPNEIGPGAPGFTGSLGSFGQNSGTLVLVGAEVKTFKNPGANICMPTLNYRIRPSQNGTNTYSNLSIPFKANCTGNVFDDGLGGCSGNDQKWSTQAADIDLTDLCPGTYTVDVYYSIPGSSSSTSACNQSANSYTATCSIDGCKSASTKPVKVTPCKTPPCPTSGNLVKNGSFERPVVTSELLWEQVRVPNWTNDGDTADFIELQRNKFAMASDGSQYAELNGNLPGDIYQDINVAASGQSINWSLDHRGRENAVPVDGQSISVVISAADGSNPQTVTHTAGITSWEQVAGTYQTLPGQTTVRIRVVSTGGNDIPGRGNFIDNVRANYVGCNPVARSASEEEEEDAPIAQRAAISLSVQPNPVIAQAVLALNGFDDGPLSIDIVSANGLTAKSIKVNYSTNTKLVIDMADYRDGMYFIKVQQNGKVATSKFVKQL